MVCAGTWHSSNPCISEASDNRDVGDLLDHLYYYTISTNVDIVYRCLLGTNRHLTTSLITVRYLIEISQSNANDLLGQMMRV